MKKESIFDSVIESINKKYGVGAVMDLETRNNNTEFVSSGSFVLNEALGGGYAKGRIIEIYGDESSGKTTLTIHAMVECQKNNGSVAFIDAEHAFDINYAQNIGLLIDKEKFIISQPDCGEQAFDIAEMLIKSNKISLLVIDSVAALTPRAEIEGDFGDSKMGLHARLMSQAMRKLTSVISNANCTVMFINQTRMKLNIMYGDPTTTTGGNALKFYASQRLKVSKIGQEKIGESIVSNKTKVKVVKNKVAPPYRECEFNITFGQGIDTYQEILNLAIEKEVIKKSGSWFSYGDIKLGQGELLVKTLLKDNPEMLEEIKLKIV